MTAIGTLSEYHRLCFLAKSFPKEPLFIMSFSLLTGGKLTAGMTQAEVNTTVRSNGRVMQLGKDSLKLRQKIT